MRILGVGELGATGVSGDGVKTLALGSCVAVLMMDPASHCVGMDHVALPDSSVSPERAQTLPGYFADTGMPALLDAMKQAGANTATRKYIVKLVGGANVMDSNNTFNIGKRNVLAIKKQLWKFGMGAVAEDVGGRLSRTVRVDVDTGLVIVSSPGRDDYEV